MKKIWEWMLCHWLGDHNWTCAAEQGIKATQQQVDAGVAGFYDYATMYCDRCGHVYRP